jgi:AcrR family transcriptional regulator
MKEKILDQLLPAIRQKGYAGLTLQDISKVTGLNKSSLYHYFPGGKIQIAKEILIHAHHYLTGRFTVLLEESREAPEVLWKQSLDILVEFYQNGPIACLLDVMSIDLHEPAIHKALQAIAESLLKLFETIACRAQASDEDAKEGAIRTLSIIQGSLVLSRALSQPSLWKNQIEMLKEKPFFR